jgi:hypothetical protein
MKINVTATEPNRQAASPQEQGGMRPDWLAHMPHHWQRGTLNRQALIHAAVNLQNSSSFDALMRSFATDVQAAYQSSWAINRVMREHARFAMMCMVMHLHHNAGKEGLPHVKGVTYSGISELFATGVHTQAGVLASPTRIKAMLGIARLSGLLVPSHHVADKRMKVLMPTPKMLEPGLAWMHGALRALESAGLLHASAQDMVSQPGMLGEVLSYNVLAYVHDHFTLHEIFSPMRRFMARDNGYVTLLQIIRTLQLQDGRWLASAAPQELSERFQASRSTVRNVLAMAQREGWIAQMERGGHALQLSESFALQCRAWVAHEVVWMAGLSNAAWQRFQNTPDVFWNDVG